MSGPPWSPQSTELPPRSTCPTTLYGAKHLEGVLLTPNPGPEAHPVGRPGRERMGHEAQQEVPTTLCFNWEPASLLSLTGWSDSGQVHGG